MKIYITPNPRASVPIKDMKLLRDQLAQVIGKNKRLASKPEATKVSNAKMALREDQTVLELNLISVQRDEEPAKVELLEKALSEVTEGKNNIKRSYSTTTTSIRNRTITGRRSASKMSEKRNISAGRKGRHLGCENTVVSRRATRTVTH